MFKSFLTFQTARRIHLLINKSNPNATSTTVVNMSTPSKVAKPNPYIATHDNTFHCDDVTACQLLKSIQLFRDHDIVRTRDPELIDKADIVVDVGAEYSPVKQRFDHHQRSFDRTIKSFYPYFKTTNPDNPPRLSSAGLIYMAYGRDYIVQQLNLGVLFAVLDEKTKDMVEALYQKAYTEFFEEIDAIDNGVNLVSGDDVEYNYHINTGLSSRVARMNPIESDASPELRLLQFRDAMEMVGAEMSDVIHFLGNVWWPKRQEFKQFVLNRKKFDPSGQIVRIESDYLVGWKSSVFELEEELDIVGEIKFIIFSSVSDESPWRATCVPTSLKSFDCRSPFPKEWCGKRAEELQKDSEVADAAFVHYNGFTGGAKSLKGITTMVRKALKLE